MVVGAAADHGNAPLLQTLGQGLSIGHHLLAVLLEAGLERLTEGHGFGGNNVLKRSALGSRKHGFVELLSEVGVVAEDQATTGTPQGFVGGGGHHVAMGHGVGMHASGHQASDVGHVGQQVSAHFISDRPEASEIDAARIRGVAANDQFGLVLKSQLANALQIELLGLRVHAVVDGLEPLTAHIHR